jgi:hypothetical protein
MTIDGQRLSSTRGLACMRANPSGVGEGSQRLTKGVWSLARLGIDGGGESEGGPGPGDPHAQAVGVEVMPRPSRRTPTEGGDGDVYDMPGAKAERSEI